MQTLIERALQTRKNIFQVAIVASIIAFGINLTSSWMTSYLSSFPQLKWIIGLLFILVGFLFFIKFLLQERTLAIKIEGLILIDPGRKEVSRIFSYGFSEKLSQSLNAVFVENEALRQAFEIEMKLVDKIKSKNNHNKISSPPKSEDDVSYAAIIKKEIKPEEQLESKTKSILIEAIEFCFLEYLSLHLSEYFDNDEHDKNKIIEVERENIPKVLLDNRVLALLTTPIEDRQIFIKSGINKHPPEGEVHAIYGSNGIVYERFHIALPKGTEISRPKLGVITLKHKIFTLTLTASYFGFSYNLPQYFSELYVSHDVEEFDPRKIQVNIEASLHPTAFLFIKGWEYYQWIDSFVKYIEDKVSFDSFISHIDWRSTATRIRTSIIQERRQRWKAAQQKKLIADHGSTDANEVQTSA